METRSAEQLDGFEPLPDHAATVIGRMPANAFGVACGVVFGLLLFFVIIVPALRGEPHLADHVGLLSQYFYGVSVTPAGALLAALYGFVLAYGAGAVFAIVRNAGVALYLRLAWRRAEQHMANDILDL